MTGRRSDPSAVPSEVHYGPAPWQKELDLEAQMRHVTPS
jgi:hypothetical protein